MLSGKVQDKNATEKGNWLKLERDWNENINQRLPFAFINRESSNEYRVCECIWRL